MDRRSITLVSTRTRRTRTRDVDAHARSWTRTHDGCTRTLVNAHTRRLRTHKRCYRERTRDVKATHDWECAHATITHAHDTSTLRHARERTHTARTHTRGSCNARSWTHTHTRRPRANAIMHARTRTHWVEGERCRNWFDGPLEYISIGQQATHCNWRRRSSHLFALDTDCFRGQLCRVYASNWCIFM